MIRSFGFAALVVLGGCGGPSAKYKVDDVSLAQIPIGEKQAIFAAEQEVSVARAEKNQAMAAIDATKHDIEIAKLEQDQRKSAMQQAKLEAEMAEKVKDLNRVAAAGDKKRVADLGQRAAEAKVDMLDEKKRWQEELVDVADAHVELALAKVELEKAKLAAAKNIMPSKDFKPENFTSEYDKKQRAMDEEKREADERKVKFEERTNSWKNLSGEYEQAQKGATPAAGSPTK